ncbi:nucleoside 2-deoxyribosyltransferase [Virgibacillus salarius]|uniref:hypothetical protein n=1 Tax=Virgibacillus salarius TaxID=447199 RepID=UPI0004289191|nr:hypothetical protein [Priestia megaterium]
MKFYIASSFKNKEHVRYLAEGLVHNGNLQTYDWTQNTRATTEKELQFIGSKEKQAVVDCDVFIMLVPAGKGSHIELGIAAALEKTIYIFSETTILPEKASTFYYLPFIHRRQGLLKDFRNELIKRS